MNNPIKIGNRLIGQDHPTYIIAEMSANHNHDIEIAKKIIHEAKNAGADCIKLQTYTADTLTIKSDKSYFKIKNGTWKDENLYELYEKAQTPWEWHKELKQESEKVGIDFLSTPFDTTAVDFLEKLGVDFYKIASFESIDIPLIEYIAKKQKPIIMSTGMANLGEIEEAVKTIRDNGCKDLCLLKCSSAYPAIPSDLNLRTINNMKEIFGTPVGFSDHSMGYISAITAIALGADVIEKHICLNREIKTPDSSFSMEPIEFKEMVSAIRIAESAMGSVSYDISELEEKSKIFRRSIFAIQDIKAGQKFTPKNIRIIRPGYGLKPKYLGKILGKIATKDIETGMPLDWDYVG